MPSMLDRADAPHPGGLTRVIALIAVLSPLFGPIGSPGLLNPDEGRYAEIAREMAATGDWMVPRLHGIPHWAKPPLSYWAIGASMRVFGVDERAARLPSALAAVLTLLATLVLGRQMGRVGVNAVVVLASILYFQALGRFTSPDMIQTACITWAAAFLWCGREREGGPDARRRLWLRLAAFACLGVSFVDKGPVALGVVFISLLVWWILRPTASLLGWRHAILGLAVTFAIGLPWFLYVTRLHPGLFDFFLGSEVRDRVLSDKHHRSQPFWFFPAVLVGGTLPWTPVFFTGLWKLFASIRRSKPPAFTHTDQDGLRFTLAWIVGPFILFQASSSKLITYLLPLMPFCALATAHALAAVVRQPVGNRRRRALVTAMAAGPAMLAIGAAFAAVKLLGAPVKPWALAAAIVTAASVAALVLAWQPTEKRLLAAACVLTATSLGFAWTAEGTMDDRTMRFGSHASHSWVRDALAGVEVRGRPISSAVRPESRPSDPSANLVCFDLKTNTLAFYLLGLRPEAFEDFGNPESWELKSDHQMARPATLEDLVALLRGPGLLHVLTNEPDVATIEKALGAPLRKMASGGDQRHRIVLLSNR